MRRGVGVGAVMAIAVAGCQSLPEVGSGVCGNLVLEAGEDCDGFGDGENTACGNPGTINGCFFVCDPDDEANNPCPDGFGCGADGRCRAPSESFTEAAQVAFPVPTFKVADIDGDGTDDLVGSSQNAFHIAFGEGDGGLTTRTFPNPALGGFFSVGDLDADGAADIVASDGNGITAFLGKPGQTIEPIPFALLEVSRATELKVTNLAGTFGLGPQDDDRQLLFQDSPDSGRVLFEESTGQSFALDTFFDPSFRVEKVETPLSVADIDGDGNQELAVTFVGATRVWVVDADGGLGNNQISVVAALDLPAGFVASGRAFFADVDNDGDLDISVGLDNGAGTVALGRSLRGAGTYGAVTKVNFPLIGDEVVSPGLRLLDAGELDGDGFADYILSTGVLLGNLLNLADPALSGSFAAGRFVDMNGDGQTDIVTIPAAATGVEVYLQAEPGPLFNRSVVGTSSFFAGNRELVTGDFDGDLVTDVALSAKSAAGDWTLEVLFGSLTNRFDPPVRMARLGDVIQIQSNRFLSSLDLDDAVDDLLVSSIDLQGDRKIVSAFRGDTSRSMSIPLLLLEEDNGQVLYLPVQTAIGTIDGATGIFATSIAFRFDANGGFGEDPNCVLKESGCGFAWELPIASGQVTAGGGPSQALGIDLDRLLCYDWGAVDLFDTDDDSTSDPDPDDTDELVGLFVSDRCPASQAEGEVMVHFNFEADSRQSVDIPISADQGLRTFVTGDLNNDQIADMVTVFGNFSPDGTATAEAGGVVVVWNEIGGLRTEKVDTADVATIAVASGRLNADPFDDLVMLGATVGDNEDPQVYAALYNPASNEYDTPVLRGEFGFGTAIGVADLNSDGLGDLVIGDGTVVRVFLAEPSPPRGDQPPAGEGEGE